MIEMGVTLKVKGNQNQFRNLFHPAQDHAGDFYFVSLVVFWSRQITNITNFLVTGT